MEPGQPGCGTWSKGRSAEVLRRWLVTRDQSFLARVTVGAMDGSAGYHTATTEQLRKATMGRDPRLLRHRGVQRAG